MDPQAAPSAQTTTVPPWAGPNHRDLYLLIAGVLLGILLGPAVLGRIAPQAYERHFGSVELAMAKLVAFEQDQAKMRGAILAAGVDPAQLAAQEQTLVATRQILVDKLNHAYASRGRLLAVLVAVVVVMVIETLPQPSAGMVRARLTTARYALVALGLALLLAQPDWLVQLPVLFAGLLVAATLGAATVPLAWRAASRV